MEKEPKKRLKNFEGVLIPTMFPEHVFRSAMNYKPKKGDIFIVTYPKCGTTWMHHIVLLILRHGKVSDDPLDFFLGCPFIEMTGAEAIEYMTGPGAMKTHLPYDKVPKSKDAKYIFVCRNPKDCIVSFYYHMKSMPTSGFEDETFDEFFEHFITGEVPYGDYFDHVMVWYEHRNDPNVHFVTYENLKKDIRGEIMKLAKFIGEEYEKAILEDPKIMDDIVHYSSFEYMKKDTNERMSQLVKGELETGEREIPMFLQKMMERMRQNKPETDSNPSMQFVRKGVVGDWKNHLNPDQLRRLEERIAEKTANSDVMSLWK